MNEEEAVDQEVEDRAIEGIRRYCTVVCSFKGSYGGNVKIEYMSFSSRSRSLYLDWVQ